MKKYLIDNKYNPKIDYVEIVNFKTMERVDILKGEVLIAVAFYIGKTRLIDNIILEL